MYLEKQNYLADGFTKNINTKTTDQGSSPTIFEIVPKQLKLRSWNFDRLLSYSVHPK